ncbi:hypothetical protein L810_5911 [Burkholderia sp. AU4i]|nr:hypothetical protein L810_5911 [Burkholderia sp. AU4i]
MSIFGIRLLSRQPHIPFFGTACRHGCTCRTFLDHRAAFSGRP